MMIDWVSGVIELRSDVPQVPLYDTGHWMKLSPGGEAVSYTHLTLPTIYSV